MSLRLAAPLVCALLVCAASLGAQQQDALDPNATIAATPADLAGERDSVLPLLAFCTVFTCAVGAVVVSIIYRNRKRTAALEAKARSLGCAFRRKPTREDKQLTAGSNLTNVGRSRTIRNVIELPGAAGARMTHFDFIYMTGSDQSSRTRQQTVTRIQSPKLNLPEFDLRPESVLAKIGQRLGMQDIDFDAWPEFSRTYLLRGPDEGVIRRMFTPDVLRYCEAHRSLWVSGARDVLWFHRENQRVAPEELASFIDRAQETFALFAADVELPSPPLSAKV